MSRNNRDINKSSGGKSYWIYGNHAVLAAINNDRRKVVRVLITKNAQVPGQLGKKANIQNADQKELEKLLPPGAVHQGIAAEVLPLEDLVIEDLSDEKLVVILDQVTDPQNVGAILRSAAAFSAGAVIVPKDNSINEGGALAKAASGALEVVPIIRVTNLANAIAYLKKHEYWVIGLDGEAKTNISDTPDYEKVALVLGAEGRGLRRLTAENCDLLVRLPISDKVESLNVSNAAAIAMYELGKN